MVTMMASRSCVAVLLSSCSFADGFVAQPHAMRVARPGITIMNSEPPKSAHAKMVPGVQQVADRLRKILRWQKNARPDESGADSTPEFLSEDQKKFVAERIQGMSQPMVQHIFDDLDRDGSGTLSFDELDFLAPYMGERRWSAARKQMLFDTIDTNHDQQITSDEFYSWAVYNCRYDREVLGSRVLAQRAERVKIVNNIPESYMSLLDELGTGSIAQKVTHPLHSDFGRTLRDHFVSCYLLLEAWGNPHVLCAAGLFHAVYQRGDGCAPSTRPRCGRCCANG